jgi:hypothetical protein
MLYDYERGYSVRTRDMHAISFESQSLEDCKRFCHDDSVIVELIPIKCGFNLRVRISNYNRGIKYDKYANSLCIGKLVIQVHLEWKHKIGKIVFDPLKDK